MTVDMPEGMVEERMDGIVREYAQYMSNQGIRIDDYLKMIGKTRDELRDEYRAEAERRVKIQLVMEQIQKEAEIKAEQEDIDAVRAYLQGLNHFEEILITRAGSVISSHCGPGTLGVLFYEA